MKVWIGNDKMGNESKGQWVKLTGDYQKDLSDVVAKYGNNWTDYAMQPDEPFDGCWVDCYTLNQLEDMVKVWNSLAYNDKKKVRAACEAFSYGGKETPWIFQNVEKIDFWPNATLKDVAEEFVTEGKYGKVPDFLIDFIDYEKLGNELDGDGYGETSLGVVYLHD